MRKSAEEKENKISGSSRIVDMLSLIIQGFKRKNSHMKIHNILKRKKNKRQNKMRSLERNYQIIGSVHQCWLIINYA